MAMHFFLRSSARAFCVVAWWLWAVCGGAVFAKNVALVPSGSVWKYESSGTDLGSAWREPDFDDSSWSSAAGELGYGDGTEQTIIPAAMPRPNTIYFRTEFDVAHPGIFTGLFARLLRDDGAIVYLNGAELMRSNMREGPVLFDTPASLATESRDETKYFSAAKKRKLLKKGRNVLAVEVHQFAANDPDVSFDFELLASATKPAAFVTRGPYLQNATASQITVRWRTNVPTRSHVRFGANPTEQPRIVRSRAMTRDHAVTLRKLEAGRRYYYSIGTNAALLEGKEASYSFRTSPEPGTTQPVHIWVLGDCGMGGDNTQRSESVRDGYLHSPFFAENDVWLMLGDNAYFVGSDDDYQAAVFDTYRPLLRNTVLWSTIGNHETLSNPSAPPYFKIFTFPKHGEGGGPPSGTESYYSFDYANIHFVCLDSMQSNRRPGSAMLRWLTEDLESTSQRWIIAFWHHPPYSKGSHDSDFELELVEMRENVVPILEEGGVDLVLSGHSHSYERSMLIDGHYDVSATLTPAMIKDAGDGRMEGDGAYEKPATPRAGAVYVVTGTAGQVSGGSYNHPVMFTSLPVLGSFVLDVNGDRLDAHFVGVDGTAQDQFTVLKSP
ncbi:MAG TPA: metallophosphoesterase family protein [Chthoniobacteraceae bacterium]|nr:metallophosphoesterase family protein [Chthoniobacteraceae bacterium]